MSKDGKFIESADEIKGNRPSIQNFESAGMISLSETTKLVVYLVSATRFRAAVILVRLCAFAAYVRLSRILIIPSSETLTSGMESD
jgi:hypothetical protein